ncbi:MAG: glycoside hydrolase [Bacillota bacterium]
MKTHKFSSKKDVKKFLRSICQAIILLLVLYQIVTALLTFNEYQGYAKEVLGPQGFIAISYFGVDRRGSDTLISTVRLEEHLKALKDSGYVTITQQDVLDYYKKGKPLPEKSLLLIFEDGRRDTAIFAQKIMEAYNFKATMLTYADKFGKKDSKFLMPDELLDLQGSTYWELGTNGYRLEYINVFDRYNNYLGELDSLEYAEISSYLDRNYNHYLMDYIRDENSIPKESYEEMKKRIEYDYHAMEEVYTKELGSVPRMYILMHSNTGQFGTNNKTSAVNEKNIYNLFDMNFNREGYSLNTSGSSIYDLTRMQPQSYWYTNHLLMRIWDDTGQEMQFVVGDKEKSKKWEMIEGKAEFKKDSIILTSMPEGRGILRLKDQQGIRDLQLSVHLEGNKLGSQAVYVRADKEFKNYISIQIKNNVLYVKEKVNGLETELFSLNLDEFDGAEVQSVEENKKEAELAELKVEANTANTTADREKIKKELQDKMKEKTSSVEEGANVYIPKIELKEPGSRYLELTVADDKISVSIDGKKAVSNLITKDLLEGSVCLEAAWGEYGYSQRNLIDDVYDGVFKELVVKGDVPEENIIFDDKLHGLDMVVYRMKEKWQTIVNWFIKTL